MRQRTNGDQGPGRYGHVNSPGIRRPLTDRRKLAIDLTAIALFAAMVAWLLVRIFSE
jgi:hypothetical protein